MEQLSDTLQQKLGVALGSYCVGPHDLSTQQTIVVSHAQTPCWLGIKPNGALAGPFIPEAKQLTREHGLQAHAPSNLAILSWNSSPTSSLSFVYDLHLIPPRCICFSSKRKYFFISRPTSKQACQLRCVILQCTRSSFSSTDYSSLLEFLFFQQWRWLHCFPFWLQLVHSERGFGERGDWRG